MTKKRHSWMEVIPSTLASLLFISQIIVGLYLLSEVSQIEILAYSGVGLYIFSGLIFGMLPVFEFRKKGDVKKGKSYIYTTRLVDSGVYSIVRHPQYYIYAMGHCGYASFPTLDCYLFRNSSYSPYIY
jgi:protein-S-isoprenylcysteine O-methyltransferase Ste14